MATLSHGVGEDGHSNRITSQAAVPSRVVMGWVDDAAQTLADEVKSTVLCRRGPDQDAAAGALDDHLQQDQHWSLGGGTQQSWNSKLLCA